MLAATVGLVVIAVLAVPAVRHWRETPPRPSPSLRVALDAAVAAGDRPFGLALAPDGRRIAALPERETQPGLVVHDLETGTSRPLGTTPAATLPFWSPDGTAIGYFAGGRLRTIDVATGTEHNVAPAAAPRGGAWLATGDIVFQPDATGGLMRLSTDDGAAEAFTTLDVEAGETAHDFPEPTPDRRHVLFRVHGTDGRTAIWWAPADNPAARRRVMSSTFTAVAANGRLFFVDGAALMSQPFDASAGDAQGRPELVATPVGHDALGRIFVTVVPGGPLVYGEPRSAARTLVWTDRTGAPQGTLGPAVESWDAAISPRATRPGLPSARVAVTQIDAQLGTLDVWAYEGTRPLPLRISTSIAADADAAWSPDGARVAWIQAGTTLMVRGSGAVLDEVTVHRFASRARLWDWTGHGAPGGAFIVGLVDSRSRADLWLLPADSDAEPTPVVRGPFNETDAAVSPDGRWIAYASDESGRPEIYADSFPVAGRRARLSLGGGTLPRWTRNGREIVYLRGNEVHAVTVSPAGPTLRGTETTRLFRAPSPVRTFDVTANGAAFLLNLPADTTPSAVRAIVNWPSLFRDPTR